MLPSLVHFIAHRQPHFFLSGILGPAPPAACGLSDCGPRFFLNKLILSCLGGLSEVSASAGENLSFLPAGGWSFFEGPGSSTVASSLSLSFYSFSPTFSILITITCSDTTLLSNGKILQPMANCCYFMKVVANFCIFSLSRAMTFSRSMKLTDSGKIVAWKEFGISILRSWFSFSFRSSPSLINRNRRMGENYS